jgi:hypothetical protein
MRFINKDGCSGNFYAEVGTCLRKDEFAGKHNEYRTLLKRYNIDMFCYIKMIRENIIDLKDSCSACYGIADYKFLTGLFLGFMISYVYHRHLD